MHDWSAGPWRICTYSSVVMVHDNSPFKVVLSTHGLSTRSFSLRDCPPSRFVTGFVEVWWWWVNRLTPRFSINEVQEMVDKPSSELFVHPEVMPNLSVGFNCEKVFLEGNRT